MSKPIFAIRGSALLAVANVPDFDPAHFGSYSSDAWRDRAISDAYEPGSTFKLITATAALESGKFTTASRFPARDSIQVGGRTIFNAEDGMMASGMGSESLEEIIASAWAWKQKNPHGYASTATAQP